MRSAIRSLGWLFIAAGVVVALYLVYSLYWTGFGTSVAQDRLLEEFTVQVPEFALDVGELDPLVAEDDTPADRPVAPGPDLDIGAAVGVMEFYRPAEDAPVVIDQPVVIVEGVTDEALKTGPGRYPGSAYPGQDGNFAVAGHRTTYGAPFWDLDKLQEGDEIHVTDRDGVRWVYEFVASEIVAPDDVYVLEPDPLTLDRPMLTLTTCNPRWSQRERLIVFAQLTEDQIVQAPAT